MKKGISVIIPVYNRERTIRKAIDSVFIQDADIELIVVDDNSIDNTEGIIKSFHDKKIIYIKNDRNMGANYSRNRGIEVASREWVAFQDSDDVWRKDKLLRQIALANSDKSIDAVYTNYLYHQKNGRFWPAIPFHVDRAYMETDLYNTLLNRNVVGTPTLMIKKSCIEKEGGFNQELPRLQDWELCIRLTKKYKFAYVDDILVDAYDTGEGISNNTFNYAKALSMIIRENEKEMEEEGVLQKNLLTVVDKAFESGKEVNCVTDILGQRLFRKAIESLYESRNIERSRVSWMCKWLTIKSTKADKGLNIDKYLNQRISIYGLGKVGGVLVDTIKRLNEEAIKYIIDIAPSAEYLGIPVYSLKKVLREHYLEKVDIMIMATEGVDTSWLEGSAVRIVKLEELLLE